MCSALHGVQWTFFYARGYAKRGIYRRRVSVCVSVCVSVALRYCIKTAIRRITQTTPHDSSFLMAEIMAKFERDHPLRGRQMQVGWVKIGHFRRKTRYNLKTVQDRRIVSIRKSYSLYQMVMFPMTMGDP